MKVADRGTGVPLAKMSKCLVLFLVLSILLCLAFATDETVSILPWTNSPRLIHRFIVHQCHTGRCASRSGGHSRGEDR